MIEHLYRYDHNAMIIESLVIRGDRWRPPPPLPRPFDEEEEGGDDEW